MLPDWQSAELAAAARRGNPAAVSQAGEPKKLVVLHGFGHYEVYAGKAFRQVMAETVPWFHQLALIDWHRPDVADQTQTSEHVA